MKIKILAVLTAVILAAVLSGCKNAIGQSSGTEDNNTAVSEPVKTKISIAEWADIEWETFSCDYFSIAVPKGWNTNWSYENDIISWRVSRPNSISCVSFTEEDKAAMDRESMEKLKTRSYMEKGSTKEYFENMYNYSFEIKYPATGSYFKAIETVHLSDNDKLCSEFPEGKLRDNSAIYAEFSENDLLGEGAYSAAVFSTDSKLWTVRSIVYESAPKGELTNWIPVYEHIISSFEYSEMMKSSDKAGSLPDISDSSPLTAAVNARDPEVIIQQEKHSDIVGGYERVYDTETKQFFRAYSGFLEDQEKGQIRYTPITEAQYTKGYTGWITKVRKAKQ